MLIAILVLIFRIIVIITLFSFLGWAFFTLWRELKFQAHSVTTKKVPYISLIRQGENSDARQIFSQPELRIGRESQCEISISDDTVSSHHARLWFKNRHWWVEDLISTNGTYLNDEKVETPTILINGDELKVGQVRFTVEIQPLD